MKNFMRLGRFVHHGRLTLRGQIVCIFFILLTIVELLTLFSVTSASYRAANDQISDSLSTAQRVFTQILKQDDIRLVQAGRALVRDFAFREAVASADQGTINSALKNLGGRVGAAAVALTDPRGVLVDTTFGQYGPEDVAHLDSYVGNAANRDDSVRIMLVNGAAFHVVIAPVRAPETLGWVFLFFPVDDALAQQLRKLTNADVTFLVRRNGAWRSLATTLSMEDAILMGQSLMLPGQAASDSRYELSNGDAVAKVFPTSTDRGSQILTVISRPLSPALSSFQKLERLLIALGAMGMAFSIVFGVIIANGIVAPLDRLRLAIREIRGGNYEQPVQQEKLDEIGAVAAGLEHMRTGIREREEKILALAFTDPLTGLPNWTKFNEILAMEAGKARSAGRSFCLIVVRLERFREINNALGADAGDEVLVQMGKRLRWFCGERIDARHWHVLARLNGSEFGILLGDSRVEDAVDAAHLIHELLNEPFNCLGQNVDIRANLGIAQFPLHAADGNALIRNASLALNVAKQNKQEHVIFDPKTQNEQREQLSLLGELQRAMASGDLQLHYQPKVDLASGDIGTAEALIRWKHPVRGWLPPALFIPFAEQTGYIKVLTRWVVKEAIRQIADWQTRDLDIQVAVNLSAADLMSPELPGFVAAALAEHRVPSGSLRFEVTESGFLGNADFAKATLQKFASAGHGLSIDDYGSGYSSLSYLRDLPVDELKLDRAFIKNLADDESLATIVRSTIEMCHGLGLTIVAEGVETDEVRSRLLRLNCDLMQGYFTSAALPAAEFERWLSDKQKPRLLPPATPILQKSG